MIRNQGSGKIESETVVTSAVVFVLGILVIGVIKGRTNALVLVPAVAVTLAVFLLNLPRQLKATPGGTRR